MMTCTTDVSRNPKTYLLHSWLHNCIKFWFLTSVRRGPTTRRRTRSADQTPHSAVGVVFPSPAPPAESAARMLPVEISRNLEGTEKSKS